MPNTARLTGPRPCPKPDCSGTTRILPKARGYIREECPSCNDIISSWPAPDNPKLKQPKQRGTP